MSVTLPFLANSGRTFCWSQENLTASGCHVLLSPELLCVVHRSSDNHSGEHSNVLCKEVVSSFRRRLNLISVWLSVILEGFHLVHCAINTHLVSVLPKVFQACHNIVCITDEYQLNINGTRGTMKNAWTTAKVYNHIS